MLHSRMLSCAWEITCENVLESKFNVAGVKSGSFDERKVVLAYQELATNVTMTRRQGMQ